MINSIGKIKGHSTQIWLIIKEKKKLAKELINLGLPIYIIGMEVEEDGQEEAEADAAQDYAMELGHVNVYNCQSVQNQSRPSQPKLKGHETISKWKCQIVKGSNSTSKGKNMLKNEIKYNNKKCLICDTSFMSNNKLHIHSRSEHPKS
ncbi:hypothetical protein Golomagni_04918 [Golovinomyces magnicellulatus]|nr:hypothetical protein Golomagni_04918 [Golovinomyces magnicellulatus]